jgi:hypothetical protein
VTSRTWSWTSSWWRRRAPGRSRWTRRRGGPCTGGARLTSPTTRPKTSLPLVHSPRSAAGGRRAGRRSTLLEPTRYHDTSSHMTIYQFFCDTEAFRWRCIVVAHVDCLAILGKVVQADTIIHKILLKLLQCNTYTVTLARMSRVLGTDLKSFILTRNVLEVQKCKHRSSACSCTKWITFPCP